MKKWLLAPGIVALLSCGGGDSPTTPTTPTPAYSCTSPAPLCNEGCGGRDEPLKRPGYSGGSRP